MLFNQAEDIEEKRGFDAEVLKYIYYSKISPPNP
jgi:hypothetical protein